MSNATINRVRTFLNPEEYEEDSNVGIGKTESMLAMGVALGAAFVARETLKSGWRATLDREPPQNPASPAVDWKDALLWGAASGALVGVARIVSRRLTSNAYQRLRS